MAMQIRNRKFKFLKNINFRILETLIHKHFAILQKNYSIFLETCIIKTTP